MKKPILALAISAAALHSHGQGTVAFGNNIASLVRYYPQPGSGSVPLPTSVRVNFGIFWGTASANSSIVHLSLNDGQLGFSSTANAGIIVAPSTYTIVGASPGSTVYMFVGGWDASFGDNWQLALGSGALSGSTDVRQVTLGPEPGPGTVIWQGATSTNPNRFNPMWVGGLGGQFPTVIIIPEPSIFALMVMSGAFWLWRVRRS